MARKSKPESEQYAVDSDLGGKKLKKKTSDNKEVVKKSGSKKAEKSKKRKRDESVDLPAAPNGKDEDANKATKVEKKKKKKKKNGDKGAEEKVAGLEDPGAGGDQVVPDDHEGPPKKKKKTKKAKPSINPLPADSADTPKKGKKKNKKSKTKVNDATSIPAPMENGGATSAVDDAVEPSATPEPPVTGDHGSKDDGSGTPHDHAKAKGVSSSFRRVKTEEWVGKRGSMDNTYEGTFGAAGWGFKAQQVLGQVRGKDFRHEKTKKKRGSYMGGKIDSSARFSFKYDSD